MTSVAHILGRRAIFLLGAAVLGAAVPLQGAETPSMPAKTALGNTYRYVAKLTGVAKRQGAVKAGGIIWQCAKDQCIASGPWLAPSVDACRALATQVGRIQRYGHATRQLSTAELVRCNGVATTTVPALKSVPPGIAGSAPAPTLKSGASAKPGSVAANVTGNSAAGAALGTNAVRSAAPATGGALPGGARGANAAPGLSAGLSPTPSAPGLPGTTPGASGARGGGQTPSREMIEEMRTAVAGISTRPNITGVSGNVDGGFCSSGGSFRIVGSRFGDSQGGRRVALARRSVVVAQATIQSWSDTRIEASFGRNPDVRPGASYNVGIQDERGRWISDLTHQVRRCPDNLEIQGIIRVENCGAGIGNILVELHGDSTVRRAPVTGVPGNDFLFQYRASGLFPRSYEVRPSLTGIECRGGGWTPESGRVEVSYRRPSVTHDLAYRVGARTLRLPLRAVAALVQDAFRGLTVHLNNFDPAIGGERTNDSFVRLPERLGGGEWRLGLLPARTGPRTYYVNDVNLQSVVVRPTATGLRVQLDFEGENNAGRFELVGVCRDDAGCIAGAPDVDLSLRVLIDLTLARHFVPGTGYTLSFSDLAVTAQPTTRVDGACQVNWCVLVGAPLPIGECMVDFCDIATNYKALIRRVVEESIRSALDTQDVRHRIGNGIRPELDALRIGTLTSVRVEGVDLVLGYLDNAR